jgi:signal transduction histidine kinase
MSKFFRNRYFVLGLAYFLYIPFWCLAETDVAYQFVKIGEGIEIELSEDPAIYYSTTESPIPFSSKFEKHDNNFEWWYKNVNAANNWIRVVINNPTDSILRSVVYYGGIPSDLHFYFKNQEGKWVLKKSGNLVVQSDTMMDDFYGCNIEINPGINTFYLYNADTWRKFYFESIEFLQPEIAASGIIHRTSRLEKLNLALFAFLMLLVFQIMYVVIQAYYHRKAEYREYIFYLLTILIYFVSRYELCFDVSIITFNQPHIRRLLNDLMLFLPFAFYLRFSRYFIEMPLKYSIMNMRIKMVERVIFFISAVFILMFLIDFIKYEVTLTLVLIIALSLYTLRLIYFFIKQRNKQIGFLLAGSLAATLGHFLGMIFSWVPEISIFLKIEPIYITMAGLSFEIFFFNTGLGYKARSEQLEKVVAQEKLIAQLKENKRMQDRLENMRNRIASDLHDDVGSTLSSIGLYSEIGFDQFEKNPEYTKGIFRKISESSQRLMTAMNDIVWAIHARQNDGENLVERINHFAHERLSPLSIKFILEIDSFVPNLTFSMEARRNILLIFKEAINNSAKYSGASEISCSIKLIKNQLNCAIVDEGIGMDLAVGVKGYGLLSIQKRTEEMNGTIEIVSNLGAGTKIFIRIPIEEIRVIETEINETKVLEPHNQY